MLVDLGYSWLGNSGVKAWVVLGRVSSGGKRVKDAKSYLGESTVG